MKKSIRFFNDREVRAVWDEERSKWWFSATDIVRAINDEEDYIKAGNYWRWLKKKLTTDGIQLVSVTHEFKFEAPDGKLRAADALDADCVQTLAKHYPNNRANAFPDWFTYSDNSIDGQSMKTDMTAMKVECPGNRELLRLKKKTATAILAAMTLGTVLSQPAAAQTVWGEKTFTVATLNVDGLPERLGIIPLNSNGPGADGTPVVSRYLADKGYDIIGVQEDFNYDAQLRSALDPLYGHGTWRGGITTAGINWTNLNRTKFDTDGLCLFWRNEHRADGETWAAWTRSCGVFDHACDALVTKGYRRYDVTLDDGTALVVYDMHLDASSKVDVATGADRSDREARASQWAQLRDSVVAHLDRRPVVIMGDMNSYYHRDDISGLFLDPINATGTHTAADAWVVMNRGGLYPQLGSDRLNPATVGYEKGEVLDKIIYINPTDGTQIVPTAYTVETDYVDSKGKPLGDHYPVAVTFVVKERGPASVADPSQLVRGQSRGERRFDLAGRPLGSRPARHGIYIDGRQKSARR